MSQTLDFELRFRYGQPNRYLVSARLSPADGTPALLADTEVAIDETVLLSLASDARAYGRALTEMVFQSPLQSAWQRALGYHNAAAVPLHLRLSCDAATKNLQALRWETLADPRDPSRFLALSTGICLSRTLDATEPSPPPGPPSPALVALVAAPHDAARFNVAPINAAGYVDAIKAFCARRPHTLLVRDLGSSPPTRENLLRALRVCPGYVYLVARSVSANGELHLWLEDDTGLGHRLPGSEFVRQIADLPQRPELIMLMVCRGAGLSHSDGWLNTLGARLVQAGVPAVLAMQGDLSLSAANQLGRALFHELDQQRPIEQAVAIAREAIAETDEWWLPVLFTRSGQRVPLSSATAQLESGRGETRGIYGLDYERGLRDLKGRLSTESMVEYLTLEARLRENLRRERLFGSTEAIRSERAEIILALNEFALRSCNISFNTFASSS